MYTKFDEATIVLYPTAGVIDVPLSREGSTALNTYVRVMSRNNTNAGISAIPGVHYRYDERKCALCVSLCVCVSAC